jgi:hypothetical protein
MYSYPLRSSHHACGVGGFVLDLVCQVEQQRRACQTDQDEQEPFEKEKRVLNLKYIHTCKETHGSKLSGKLVAAITITPSDCWNPSISTSN